METVTISWDLLIQNWAIGAMALFLVCRATRHVQSPWLRHLPRAVVGGLTFVPSMLVAGKDQIVPAVVAAFILPLEDWTTGNVLGWAFLPPILGILAWWLFAAGLAQLRETSPLPGGGLAGISLIAFVLTLAASVGVFFAVPRVEIESIIAIFMMTGSTLAVGGCVGAVLAWRALRKGERPKWGAVVGLVLNGLIFALGLPGLALLLVEIVLRIGRVVLSGH